MWNERFQRVEMCQNERFQPVEICQNERFQRVEIYQTVDISTNTEMSIDCLQVFALSPTMYNRILRLSVSIHPSSICNFVVTQVIKWSKILEP